MSMLLLVLHFIKNGRRDDLIKIYKLSSNEYRWVFYPNDMSQSYAFRTHKSMICKHIQDTLALVSKDDMDPYDYVQISTMLHPAIMFHVSDLTNEDTLERIWTLTVSLMNIPITKKELSSPNRHPSNANSERVSDS